MPGVIGHIVNPTAADAAELAVVAEANDAEWIGFADAFWWRDVWMILAEVARVTERIRIGPAMTNTYLRHPFHTLSAIATLEHLAGARTLLGLAAGGSEITHAAGISRSDAAERTDSLLNTLDAVVAGDPLDPTSGRTLEVNLTRPRLLVAGRGDQMLRLAGQRADDVLLWAIPDSELERSIDLIRAGWRNRDVPPRLIWAPLVKHSDGNEASLLHIAVYASLNTRRSVRLGWGMDDALVDKIRAALVRGGTTQASSLVPSAALDELLLIDTDPHAVATRAGQLGIGSMATPGFDSATLADQLEWATSVEAILASDGNEN